ncbi:ABC transporter ATP-binding protein [Thermanaeromonas sp. C210]|uniref:ABC transporter ATP-binding protein n=1 Tax=Thermanaeromonas sp. C210 TaxID=2731925 RepID=UPI00155D0A6D|nr:ABC transporter ATP-binding protein [Thermanaeromonas sp. C210]GFN24244.1 spermidine/putrescine ABC transporter ATP-binding protein [Thermanaeromonas sp. C210]
MAELKLINISKAFGKIKVINDFSLHVKEGEFLTLLGPSGCGKTTLLRIIAGFVYPDQGDIYFDDQRVNDLPPNRRDTAMVFQSYALFPHMTVKGNISFGLKMKKVPRKIINERLEWAVNLVGLSGLEDRLPRELSGGQQQRVALARALVMHPRILLFDEPLSNLDAKLRERMRIEIRELQQRLGITTVYVTHDQAEALVISDRIAIMRQGYLLQVGAPEEIYKRPNSQFVADFIGLANFIKGTVEEVNEKGCLLETPIGNLKVERISGKIEKGSEVIAYIRPEDIILSPNSATENLFKARVSIRTYMGSITDYHLDIGGTRLRAQQSGEGKFKPEEIVNVYLPPEKCGIVALQGESGLCPGC